MRRTWFITGASRGIGEELVNSVLHAGDNVVATARDPKKIKSLGLADRLLSVELDVTDNSQINRAVKAAVNHFGSIDVLVNNAGYGHLGVFEEITSEEIHAEFNTNVFGLMNLTRAILPYMREQRSGRIFNISSIAGLKGNFGGSAYNSSKFAVEGFSQSIAEELAPFGVYVTCISPGFFRTDFLDISSFKSSNRSISDYDEVMNKYLDFINNRNHNQLGDPKKLAKVLIYLSSIENPPVSFLAGSDAIEWAMNANYYTQSEIEKWNDLSCSTDGAW
ncbi:MAG: SDR family NAD(P)-dependent oxidoreductase [Tatlockia sp.]|nr:SDR family NAD(P)-dependent oxidoreductase [Tatlockia sp.]